MPRYCREEIVRSLASSILIVSNWTLDNCPIQHSSIALLKWNNIASKVLLSLSGLELSSSSYNFWIKVLKCLGNKCFICSLFHIWPDSRQYNDRRSRTGSILWKTAIWGQSGDRLRAFFGVCADGYIVAWTKGGDEEIFSRSSGHSIHAIMCCLWFEQICRQWYGTNKHDQGSCYRSPRTTKRKVVVPTA